MERQEEDERERERERKDKRGLRYYFPDTVMISNNKEQHTHYDKIVSVIILPCIRCR